MKINFSTTQINYAQDYLYGEHFKWLNDKQKEYIMDNLGDIRIQDPMMYPKPKIEIHSNQGKHNDEIMKLGGSDDR